MKTIGGYALPLTHALLLLDPCLVTSHVLHTMFQITRVPSPTFHANAKVYIKANVDLACNIFA